MCTGNPSWQFILGSNVFCLSWKLVCFRISVEQQQLDSYSEMNVWKIMHLLWMSGLLCCIRFTNFLSFDVNLLIFQLLIYRFPGYAIFLVRKYPNFSGYSWMSNIKFINFWWNCFVVCTTIFSLRILTSKRMTPAFVISFLLRIQTPFHENMMLDIRKM